MKKLFWAACVPLRILLIVGAYLLEQPSSTAVREPFVALAIVMALGFLASNINSKILNKEKEVRGFAGSVKYWDSLAHSAFYFLFAFFLFQEIGNAYVILITDLIFGIITVLEHYYF